MRSLKNNILEGILDIDDNMEDIINDHYRKAIFHPWMDKKLSDNDIVKDVIIDGDTFNCTISGKRHLRGSMFKELGFKIYNITIDPNNSNKCIYIEFLQESTKTIPAGTTINMFNCKELNIDTADGTLKLDKLNISVPDGSIEIGRLSGTDGAAPGITGCNLSCKDGIDITFKSNKKMFDDKCFIKCDYMNLRAYGSTWDPAWRYKKSDDYRDACIALEDIYEGESVKALIGTENVDIKSVICFMPQSTTKGKKFWDVMFSIMRRKFLTISNIY